MRLIKANVSVLFFLFIYIGVISCNRPHEIKVKADNSLILSATTQDGQSFNIGDSVTIMNIHINHNWIGEADRYITLPKDNQIHNKDTIVVEHDSVDIYGGLVRNGSITTYVKGVIISN